MVCCLVVLVFQDLVSCTLVLVLCYFTAIIPLKLYHLKNVST